MKTSKTKQLEATVVKLRQDLANKGDVLDSLVATVWPLIEDRVNDCINDAIANLDVSIR